MTDFDPIDYAEILRGTSTAGDDDAAERMANALLINALSRGATLFRFEPPDGSHWVQFKIDGHWQDEVELPTEIAGDVVRRFRVMASLPIGQPGPAMGHILLCFDPDSESDAQMRVLVRPASMGDRMLVRVVPDDERAKLAWRIHEGTEAAEEQLRGGHERLFQMIRTAEPEAATSAARSFLSNAESLLPGAYRLVLEARMLLSQLAEDADAVGSAIDEVRAAIDIAEALGAPPMSTSVLLEQLAELLERSGDRLSAIDARQRALTMVEATLGHEDPYIAGVFGRLAGTLAAVGRTEEASEAYETAIRILSDLAGDDDLELREIATASAHASG